MAQLKNTLNIILLLEVEGDTESVMCDDIKDDRRRVGFISIFYDVKHDTFRISEVQLLYN